MHVGSKGDAYRQSLVDCAALTSENMALREALERQTSIKARLKRETEEFLEQLRPVDSPLLPPTLSCAVRAAPQERVVVLLHSIHEGRVRRYPLTQ